MHMLPSHFRKIKQIRPPITKESIEKTDLAGECASEIDDDEINNFAQLINQLRNGARLPSLQCSPQIIYSFTIHVSLFNYDVILIFMMS